VRTLRLRGAAGCAKRLATLRIRTFRALRARAGLRRRSTFLARRNNSISLHCLHIKQVTEWFELYPRILALSFILIPQFQIKKCIAG
jgi:hypothetical protein